MKRFLLLGALLFAAAGCGFFSRSKSAFYSIDTVPATPRIVSMTTPVAIDVVELPPGADRREIVVQEEGGKVSIRERDQWTASLEPLMLHTLAHNLAARLPAGSVILPGQPVPNGPMRAFDVIVERMDAGPGNQVTLVARWTLRERNTAAASQREEIVIPIASLSSGHIAGGYTAALAKLSDRMTDALLVFAKPVGTT